MATERKVGSGGRRKRGLAGRGPTPKAEDRVYHKAYKGKSTGTSGSQSGKSGANRSRAQGKGAGADWVVGRNPVLEAMAAGLRGRRGRARRPAQ